MGKKHVLRIVQAAFEQLRKAFHANPQNESQAFCLCSIAETPEVRLYQVTNLILPEAPELANQSSVSVEPTREFQANVYGMANDLGRSVFDFHNHPWSENPHLSSIDLHHGTRNAKYVSGHFPSPSTMGMVVFGGSMRGFEGRVWDREAGCFRPIKEIEVLGSPMTILDGTPNGSLALDETYVRQQMIPGWVQDRLERLKVFIAGLGGNGSLVFAALLALGVGKRGWLRACDPDGIEQSNLPRIPYAFPEDVGKPKAAVAQAYAARKASTTPVLCYHDSIQSEAMKVVAKEAHLLIGAGDNDTVRKILNALSVRYLIPYLDLGTEIIPTDSSCEAAGQVRAVLPGSSGCLICSGSVDATDAAVGLLSKDQVKERERFGYVRGTKETPAPSVLHLNGVTAYLAVSQLVRLVLGENLERSEFLHYERQGCQLVAATVRPNPDCPVCGQWGYLGAGDEIAAPLSATPAAVGKLIRLSKGCRGEGPETELEA
jgi:molybdopterin/thiamine biosynthesis adenylyltransferase